MSVAVSVRLVDMRWFFADRKNFVAFSAMLSPDLPNGVYTSELVECLIDQSWADLRRTMVLRYFIVYLVYACSAIVYMKMALAPPTEGEEDASFSERLGMTFFCLITLALWGRQVYLETK